MTLMEAIDIRISRRNYKPEPLANADAEKLWAVITEHTKDARMELIVGDGRAFAGLTKSYGMFKDVQNCIVLVTNALDADSGEKLGYYGELVILNAIAMGLGTCWVGGTFDKKLIPVTLAENEKIASVITIGYVSESQTGKERFIRKVTHRKSKTVEQMSITDTQPPYWFINGVTAAQKAPSAVNRQPVVFSYKNGEVSASVKDMSVAMIPLDLGIAKLHFALGAGNGKWQWGNGGKFIIEET